MRSGSCLVHRVPSYRRRAREDTRSSLRLRTPPHDAVGFRLSSGHTGFSDRTLHIRAMSDEKVGDLPMAEKGCVSQFTIQVDAREVPTGVQNCLQGGRVVVVDEPLQQLDVPRMQHVVPVGQLQQLEYQVRPSTRDSIANSCLVHFQSPARKKRVGLRTRNFDNLAMKVVSFGIQLNAVITLLAVIAGCATGPGPTPLPIIPSPRALDSVPLGDSGSFPELKLDLSIAPGPFEPTWASIEKNYPGEPAWLRDAKF